MVKNTTVPVWALVVGIIVFLIIGFIIGVAVAKNVHPPPTTTDINRTTNINLTGASTAFGVPSASGVSSMIPIVPIPGNMFI